MPSTDERRLSADSELFRQRFAELVRSGRLVAPMFGGSSDTMTDSRHSAATYGEDSNSHILGGDRGIVSGGGDVATGATDAAAAVGNIIQITVVTFIELVVQPHQVRISSGGGGSDRGGWNDKEKNEYRPRRRR